MTSISGSRTAQGSNEVDVSAVVAQLEDLRKEMRRRHLERARTIERVHPSRRRSAANLIDYLTLRRHDIRALQESLAELGLSSLGRSEEHVLTTIERVLANLRTMTGENGSEWTESAIDFGGGRAVLESNADVLLGPSRPGRPTRILVTMPTEAADDIVLVRAMLSHGMDCARIDRAHRRPGTLGAHDRAYPTCGVRGWPILSSPHGSARSEAANRPIEPGPRVIRLRPKRDAWGRAFAPSEPCSSMMRVGSNAARIR